MEEARTGDDFDRRLEWIRERSGSDFIAYAQPAGSSRRMGWDRVLGGSNVRVQQMVIKPGIGLGGMVMRHGTVYTVHEGEKPFMREECPVMLAEKLLSGMAFPVTAGNSTSSSGILLLGRRDGRAYAKPEAAWIQSAFSGRSACEPGMK
ncbi:hypothetical protein [Paenibacillus sp. XY044]|uniref:hypothetical protein n=1 Tax=Paenibacillus sp. XY044 TaxID=2026089 RepID=UPI000B997E93|nr:hypothetical protein [Paenibacillus sp. XY044]OZB91223.1 hypothetical protein CJP46_28400 [Paenibacillus sp. XY044]